MLNKILFGGAGGGSQLADLGLMLLRGYAGLAMALAHGWGKLQDPAGIIGGTEKMGFPLPTFFGWMAILAEFGGGLLLAIGLATRPAAFLIMSTMGVAALVAHANDPFARKELAVTYFMVALLFLFTGSGRYGADALLRRRRGSRGFPLDRRN